MLNYFKSKREHKIRRTYTFDPKVIEELDNYCDENSINKSDIGLLIHSGVYRINFRAEPAFAPNIQKYMGLGDDEISPQSRHVFSFDVLDGTCGPHHAIQTISDMFQYINCKYAT